ncbi:tetratricopeptide repeat protein [Desulfovibrio ferrophilus]|uniref:Tetratricopeptide TPR_1 repeat-containing protein n=1 Tax=Desulfovibrio ferrophilus TaxID=241368 RepID=A0A2Z6AXX3_9BACT|nr:tetratricopeptide repeat protein [Desulfovibrio ferrophilus]BBD07996.1 tetratricopeptide TPR_1 repeat-containing protein [Desulfovibrio ferrophilus]
MSSELIKARSKISNIKSYLKQDKLLPAIVSLHESVGIICRTPLLKHEQEEFERSLDIALDILNHNDDFRKVCPMVLEYKKGGEKELLSALKELLDDLQSSAVSDAQALLQAIDDTKRIQLERGKHLLEKGKFKDAKFTFDKLLLQFPDDTELKYEIAELYLKFDRNKEALKYLTEALRDLPESSHLYNRVAMVLRKLEEFEMSEKYYNKAVKLSGDDPGLYFNFGRLYIDWKRWEKVDEMATKAIELNKGFTEAHKMRKFANKQLAKQEKAKKNAGKPIKL